MKIPPKYVPSYLTPQDRRLQLQQLRRSRRDYLRERKFPTRNMLKSFHYRASRHTRKAQQLYGVESIVPSAELAQKTGCSVRSLKQIVRKGEGAFYSSGSRPNQTPQSWGHARLASALTAGKAAIVDFHILKTCNHKKPAYLLAKKLFK